MYSPNMYDVIVVGGGLSGLQAAVTAHEAGLSCLVLEANDRIGGKVLTAANPSGANNTVDLGAAWINDTTQSHMWALAQKHGAEFEKQNQVGDCIIEFETDKVIRQPLDAMPGSPEEQQRALELIYEIDETGRLIKQEDFVGPVSRELDQMTFQAWLEQRAGDLPPIVATMNFLVRALVGADAKDVSALYMLKYIEAGTGFANISGSAKDGGQYLRPKKGSIIYVDALAASLPARSILTSTPVTSITQSSTHCTITTSSNTNDSFKAKKVIISIPTTLYHHITFTPPLPPTKQALITSTKMGYYSKLVASYSIPWWRNAGLAGEVQSLSDTSPITMTLDTSVDSQGQYSLSMFLLSQSGRLWSALPTSEARAKAGLDNLARLYGPFMPDGKIPEPLGTIEKDWTKDQWFEGAPCALYGVGLMTSEAGRSLKASVGHVHFVGTEMSDVWKGYMEGAVRDGERGGKEVIEALKG